MGVTYKLETKVKDFILEEKKKNPALSCRKLSDLILDKFQIKVSKSSVNFVVKEAGLSMPVGRRQKKRIGGLNPEAKLEMKVNLELTAQTLFLEKLPEAPAEEIAPPAEAPKLPEEITELPVEKQVEEPVVEETIPLPADKPVEAVQEAPIPIPVEQTNITPVDKPVEKLEPIESPDPEIQIEEPSEMPCSGAILLKAADYLTGGIYYITEAIKSRLNSQAPELFAKTEHLLYGQLKQDSSLWGLTNRKFSPDEISSYLAGIQSVAALSSDIFRVLSAVFQEVRYITVTLTDNSVFYLDAKFHTVWSTPSIPYDFSSTIYNTKSYINKCFQEDSPAILFMAPGYDYPTVELFNFILSQDQGGARVSRVTLCGNKFEELETINLEKEKKRFFVFGLWPWQFVEYRKVNKIGEFKPFHFVALNKDYYIAEIEIELFQPITSQTVTLKGSALKTSLAEKTRLLILSNLNSEEVKLEDLVNIYLSRWPNLEEAFRDFSRKIELFTYTADSQRFFSTENLNLLIKQESLQDINALFDYYLKALDLYVRWHFLPSGYEEKDFSTVNQHFYGLKALAKKEKDSIKVTFEIPSAYPHLKDLEYVCRRINEREICFADGKRLWCSIAGSKT